MPLAREACEKAKIRLSSRDTAVIYVPDFFVNSELDNDLDYLLSRESFQEIAQGFVARGIGKIDYLLQRLNIDRRRIGLCLATGGMVNTPSIKDSLAQLFGADRLHISPRGERIISEGCAWIAEDQTRLRLAKPIEVVEARETYLSVFKAGDPLPIEGEAFSSELNMYCVDPRDGFAKIKMARPRFLGKVAASDPRDNYTNISVRVEHGAETFRERIEVEFKIDHDLVVDVTGRSMLLGDVDRAEIFDLEFSLSAGNLCNEVTTAPESQPVGSSEQLSEERGGTQMRSNVSTKKDSFSLVPGELLYTFKKALFDTRNPDPLPKVSHEEKLFYSPCSICKRRYNDPLCNCSALID